MLTLRISSAMPETATAREATLLPFLFLAVGLLGGLRIADSEMWAKRSLADREVVYVWADGIYVKAGLERDKAALLVVMGAMRDGTKEVLAAHIRLPGVNGLVGGGLSGSQGSRPRSAEATDGRR